MLGRSEPLVFKAPYPAIPGRPSPRVLTVDILKEIVDTLTSDQNDRWHRPCFSKLIAIGIECGHIARHNRREVLRQSSQSVFCIAVPETQGGMPVVSCPYFVKFRPSRDLCVICSLLKSENSISFAALEPGCLPCDRRGHVHVARLEFEKMPFFRRLPNRSHAPSHPFFPTQEDLRAIYH